MIVYFVCASIFRKARVSKCIVLCFLNYILVKLNLLLECNSSYPFIAIGSKRSKCAVSDQVTQIMGDRWNMFWLLFPSNKYCMLDYPIFVLMLMLINVIVLQCGSMLALHNSVDWGLTFLLPLKWPFSTV